MSIKGSPYTRFRRAVQSDSPTLATAAAHELPQLGVADALRLCLVYARADAPLLANPRHHVDSGGVGYSS